jgi:histidine kinase
MEKQQRWFRSILNGVNLRNYLFKNKLGYIEVVGLAIQLAAILQYLHQNGVIHKDINPENIMITNDGQLELIDFGISTNLSSETNEAINIGKIEGTLTYISPEQTGRTAYTVRHTSDFYSFGILIYELLTGKPPFDSVDPLEVIHFHLSRKPIPLTNLLPDLPKEFEQIVFKLIAKNPDERYFSAAGLKADLELIKIHLTANIPLEGFKAGANDITGLYKQTQKLYGREDEINELLGYYHDLHRVKSMLILVAGYSGVGKSALIKHIKFPIIQQQGTFIGGKFDQYKKDIPYYAFIEAIKEFIKNLLAEPDVKINAWKERISFALSDNARLITDVIPQLSRIIENTTPVSKLQPAEQESRFNMVLLDFIYAFSTPESPLVIFLDDLQWADLPSLNLVKRIMDNSRKESILIIGSYRDNEVEKGHPLFITMKQISESDGLVKTIHLKPLNEETTCQITADSFDLEYTEARKLGQHVFSKTNGNPFFIHSFLKSLYDRKLIKTHAVKKWIWNQEEIEKLQYTDNVIDLMTDGLSDLPAHTREVLQYAAVLGNTFGLADLSDTIANTPSQLYSNLKPAIKGGYINPVDTSYRTLALNKNQTPPDIEFFNQIRSIQFTFSHDKVQQAAYNLIPSGERPYVHLKIARLLIQNRNKQQLLDDIFEVLNHFVMSFQLIENQEEKLKVAELCFIAGKKAKDSTSYNQGVNYLTVAKELLGDNPWSDHYELTYNVLKELGECEYLNDNPAQAEYHFKELLSNSKTRFEKLKVYYIHSSLYLKMGNTSESLRLGLEAAILYDIHFPQNKVAIQVNTLFILAKYLFLFSTKYKNPEILFDLKDCNDEEIIALNKFLIDLATSAYQQNQNLMMLVIFKIVQSYLRHGFTDASGWGFSGFSVVVLSALKMQQKGFNLWDITVKLHERTHSPLIKWRLNYTVLCFHNHWRFPFRKWYNQILETIKACTLNGDQIFTGYSVALYARARFNAGENIKEILDSSEEHKALIKNTKGGFDFFQGFYQMSKALNNRSANALSWNDDTFNDEQTFDRLLQEGNKTKLALFLSAKCNFLYLTGNYHDALIESNKLQEFAENFLGDMQEVSFALYTSLSISAYYKNLKAEEKKKYLKTFKKHLKDMKLWAKGCPENYNQHYHLLLAELFSIQNNPDKALHYYGKTIQLAAQNSFYNIEGIANERAAALCETLGMTIQNRMYLKEAWNVFNIWGAHLLCKKLENKYPELSARTSTQVPAEKNSTGRTSLTRKTDLDLASVLKVSQTIARQVKYDDVLKNLMHITIENAGAEKGCLLLYKGDQLCIEAVGISGTRGIEIFPSIPYDETDLVPKSAINYCRRTEEMIVVNDAGNEDRFSSDKYISQNNTLSVLCLPITAVGKIIGILYLENNLLKGTFNADRIEMLRMLSGQIGISIENSLLYENLEEKVQERTREITKTLSELKATQTQLIQSEKMASLGELTAGIAHEIQNPLNFVTNFSEINSELINEMQEELDKGEIEEAKAISFAIRQNLDKINHHGKRADAIVKGMLQHSRTSNGQKEPTDINALADEYLRLSYHGLLAKDKSFNAEYKTNFDPALPKINVIPQDIGRVLLNLINNAFYAVQVETQHAASLQQTLQNQKDYKPMVVVSTKKTGTHVEISVKDNGPGIPSEIKDKIFQPFFTTKPTGQGTGLGLSLSYDIVKAHGGELKASSKNGGGAVFMLTLPVE